MISNEIAVRAKLSHVCGKIHIKVNIHVSFDATPSLS